jgi:hypothetical protein
VNRLLLVLASLAALLVLADSQLQRLHRQAREQAATLRPLTPVRNDQIASLEIVGGGRTWVYVHQDGLWRFPGYCNAVAAAARLDAVAAAFASYGTPVSTEPGDLDRYGLGPDQQVRLTARDAAGRVLAAVLLGRGAPGPHAADAYALPADRDTVFHLQANPRPALLPLDRPLLDPHVLPARAAAGLAEIAFGGTAGRSFDRLRRAPPSARAPSAGGDPSDRAEPWFGQRGSTEQACPGAVSFTAYLLRLRWATLAPADAFRPDGRWLRLVRTDGAADTLELGSAAGAAGVAVRVRPANQVCLLPPAKAALLFPGPAVLSATGPEPSAFDLAEPPRAPTGAAP